MLLLSLIPPASPWNGAASQSRPKLTAPEELELATRLLELRRELLAIALLDPASRDELERIAAELQTGRRRIEAVVDEPDISPEEARARFERFCAQVQAVHAPHAPVAPSKRPEDAPSSLSELTPALDTALGASAGIARSLRLDWALVEQVLQSSWVQRPRAGRQRAESLPALPPELAERAQRMRAEADATVLRFVTSHQGLVYNVAQRYRGLGLSREDLVQDGNIGLLRAIEKFDAQRGKPFAGYAVWWVRQAMRHALATRARTIRLPTSALARRSTLRRASDRLAQELGRDPSQQELASATGVAAESIADVMRMSKEPISLDAPRSTEHERSLGDCLSDPTAISPNDHTWARELAAELRTLFEGLTPRERHVLDLRFGLNGSHEHTLEEIGNTLGLTRERIRQIVAAALDKLNHASKARELQP